MRQSLHVGLTVAGAALAVTLGQCVPSACAGKMPQAVGEDVLAMILGDARLVFSDAMMDKAEEYFHGGVRDVVCEHGLGTTHEEPGHHAAGEHGLEHAGAAAGTDFWGWLNGQIHVQEDRHIEGEDVRELLPWLWAACRSAPQSIRAYETTAFVLAHMTKRPADAVRLLEEGIVKNPDNASLEISLGELLLQSFHDLPGAERVFEAARRKCRTADGPEGAPDRVLKVKALFYLGYLAKQRGDLARARECLSQAEQLAPDDAGTRDLKKMLQEK